MTKTNKAAIAIYSNSPYQPTGYGQQSGYLAEQLLADGHKVAALTNYGLVGTNSKLDTPRGPITHYGQSFEAYGNDIHPANFKHFTATNRDLKPLLITLYDVWVLDKKAWSRAENILSWVPLDRLVMPPKVKAWLEQPNVRPVAMAPNGVRQMEANGIECDYAPHAIDTNIFKPVHDIDGIPTREVLGITEETFLVGMVAANKSDSGIHRKAFFENLTAFSLFKAQHPDAKLYLHTDMHGSAGGWDLSEVCRAVGLADTDVIAPNQVIYRWGHSQQEMAALFTTFDVYLGTSYGEGFGIGTIEAMACGTIPIVSNFAASPDLLPPELRIPSMDGGFLVDGQPIWHNGLAAPFAVPNIQEIYRALENAYYRDRAADGEIAREWVADNFDVAKVWRKHWQPILARALA